MSHQSHQLGTDVPKIWERSADVVAHSPHRADWAPAAACTHPGLEEPRLRLPVVVVQVQQPRLRPLAGLHFPVVVAVVVW